ncbi:MAG: hypothetical protein JNG85_05835, partial [Spirochaetaceae bacterium]|nr:hypothetical protein [Spirochaetaceae bacterium]
MTCNIVCWRLKKEGIKGLEPQSRIGFDLFAGGLQDNELECYVAKIKSKKPDQAYTIQATVRLPESLSGRLGAEWLRFCVSHDRNATFWYFPFDAYLLRPGAKLSGERTQLMFKFEEKGTALILGTPPAGRAQRFHEFVQKLQLAPEVDSTSREELEGLWGAYIKALEELSRRRVLFFHVTDVSEPFR